MVIGLVVPHDATSAIRKAEFNQLADYQLAVGGFIETVQLLDHPLVIVANEDGKMQRLPINVRATLLWWLLNPAGMGGDMLVGDVAIVGPTRDSEFSDVSERLAALLLAARRFEVRVCVSQKSNAWVPIGEQADDFFEAATRALRLMEVWNPPSGVKVVAVE